jgi:methylated-DNA-[protein]-cysteine S-methyltransferase
LSDEVIHIGHLSSPLGCLSISATNEFVFEIHFLQELPVPFIAPEQKLVFEAALQLEQYFAGNRTQFDFPIKQSGTAFQQQVWHHLLQIQYGRTISYMQLSKWLRNPKAIRAVGTANGSNQLAIVVPCHRVIGSDGSLTGYAGGIWRKQWLLQHENKQANGVQVLF